MRVRALIGGGLVGATNYALGFGMTDWRWWAVVLTAYANAQLAPFAHRSLGSGATGAQPARGTSRTTSALASTTDAPHNTRRDGAA